jgi:hypothetical protein
MDIPHYENGAEYFKPSTNPGMHRRARRPFDFYSAGGGVYVAEEQMKFASYINFWP